MMSDRATYTLANLHEDHQQWRRDHTAWFEEVERWIVQQAAMLSDLEHIREALQVHGSVLQGHGTTAREGEARIAGHERAITEYTQRGTGAELAEELVHRHQAHSESHVDTKRSHQRLKARHARIVGAVASLKAELSSA
jgi:hypothetical protein